jgi:cytochrome c-type biogenesis protein CcmH
MVARYGNFVRLRPPFNAMTFMLWGAPGIAVLVGIALAMAAARRRRTPPEPLTEAERQRLAELLKS